MSNKQILQWLQTRQPVAAKPTLFGLTQLTVAVAGIAMLAALLFLR